MNNLKAERTLTAEELQDEFERIIREEVFPDYSGEELLGVDRAVKSMASIALRSQSLSTQQPMGEVKVRAFDWQQDTDTEWGCRTVLGHYAIYQDEEDEFSASGPQGHIQLCATLVEAKAVAETEYSNRILSCLHPNQESGE